jgi:hypothetical protein
MVMLLLRRSMWLGLLGVVGVVAAEVMARVDDGVRLGIPVLASPSHNDLTMQDSLGTRGRPFARFEKWKLNAEGFRSQEITLRPRRECVRVAVMGASETFGYAESPGKEYPAQLADSLNRTGCYEVINTAIVGLPTTGQIQLWENWVSRFEPSVVVIYVSPVFYLSNDPPKFPAPKRGGADPKGARASTASTHFEPRLLDRLHDHIHYPDFIQRRRVMRTIAQALAGKGDDWVFTSVPDDRLALFRSHLDSLVASVRAKGAVPVLVTHAMRFGDSINGEDEDLLRAWRQFTPRATEGVLIGFEREAAGTVRETAREREVPLADVANLMTGRTKWFADFVHFNDDGAGVIAGAIARTVESIRVPSGSVASTVPASVESSNAPARKKSRPDLPSVNRARRATFGGVASRTSEYER